MIGKAARFAKKVLPSRAYSRLKTIYSQLEPRRLYLAYPISIFGRYPAFAYPKLLSIFLTTRCNLRCFICRPEGFKGSDLDLASLHTIEKAVRHAETIELTGWGEPLVYPAFEEVLAYLYSINTRRNLIQLTTNGTRLSAKVAKLLSGRLKLLTISLNAATPETYFKFMRHDFAQVISRIDEFMSALPKKDRCKVKLHFVAHKETYHEVPAFIELAHTLGIPTVSIGHFFTAKREHIPYTLLTVKEEYNKAVSHAQTIGAELDIEVIARKFFEEEEKYFYNPDRDCLDPYNSMYIDIDGNVSPCCFAPTVFMGNVHKDGLEKVWFGDGYRKLRKKKYLPACRSCAPYIPLDDHNAHINSLLKDGDAIQDLVSHIEQPRVSKDLHSGG